MKVFIFDNAKCNGCYNCQLACKDEHCGNNWLPYALPQPDTGHFWLKLNEKTHGTTPKVRVEYWPTMCNHCDHPACVEASRDGAVYKREDGLVIFDPIKAKGQKQLVDACPYHAVYWNESENVAQKCTGCAQLVDEGKMPRCVDMCATEALRFGEEEEFAELIAKAETMLPGSDLGPRVYYLNMPRLFIGGTVFDPAAEEIIQHATVILTCKETGEVQQTLTDNYGDFWFRTLNPKEYELKIMKNGFKSIHMASVQLTESLNVGDLAMEKY